jgi:predicted nucleic acid-binding protein
MRCGPPEKALLLDERTDIADALAFRMQVEGALAPDLFWREAGSLLIMALRRGRITEAGIYISLHRLATIPLRNAGASDAVTVTRLAIRHGLSVYDAAYLDLALREHLPLATLGAAAQMENVPVIGLWGSHETE